LVLMAVIVLGAVTTAIAGWVLVLFPPRPR